MELSLSNLFMIWWIFGYAVRVLFDLFEEMEDEKHTTGHYNFTWF